MDVTGMMGGLVMNEIGKWMMTVDAEIECGRDATMKMKMKMD